MLVPAFDSCFYLNCNSRIELSMVAGKALRRPWFSPLLFRLRDDRICWGYGGGK